MIFPLFRRRKTELPHSRTSSAGQRGNSEGEETTDSESFSKSFFMSEKPSVDEQTESRSPTCSKPSQSVGTGLEERLNWFGGKLERCSDAVFHSFTTHGNLNCALVYMKGMTDVKTFQESVLQGILSTESTGSPQELIRRMVDLQQVAVTSFKQETEVDETLAAILDGHILLLLDGEPNMLLSRFLKWKSGLFPNRLTKKSFGDPVNRSLKISRRT